MIRKIVEQLVLGDYRNEDGYRLEDSPAFVELAMLATEADKILSDDYDLYEEYRFIQNKLALDGFAVNVSTLERIEDARYEFLVAKGIVAPEG